jgi:hypothetical protein
MAFLKWKMCSAIKRGDVARVAALLAEGADVNMDLGQRETPLHLACQHGKKQVAALLLKQGADVNAIKKYDWAPIHDAAYGGHFDIVVDLLKAGADPNLRTEEGRTAHGWAEICKRPDIAALLSPYMKKAVEIAEEKQLKLPKAPEAPATDWTLLSAHQVARAQTMTALGYRLTDVFNFRDRERIRIVHNIETRADQASSLSFDDISEKAQLEDARLQLIRLGGNAPEESVSLRLKLSPPRTGG